MEKGQKLSEVTRQLERIEEEISALPKGSANVYDCNGRVRIKGRIGGRDHFFNQDEMSLVGQLVYKKYLEEKRKELICHKRYLQARLAYESKGMGRAERYLAEHPMAVQYLQGYLRTNMAEGSVVCLPSGENEHLRSRSKTDNYRDPSAAPYQDQRIHPTAAGIRVRSKSEVMIVSVLCERGIDFCYEKPLAINGVEYYPDFTLYDPVAQKSYYFEHFGMMDDMEYERRAWNKISRYIKAGIMPGVNLTMTFETREQALTIPQIRAAIDWVL